MKQYFLIIFILIISFSEVFSQAGSYIKPYWLYQYTSVSNPKDFYSSGQQLEYQSTYHQGAGISFIHNSSDIFGIETGFRMVVNGQKYKGHIDDDFNTPDTTDPLDFQSEIILQYFQIPLLFSFNSRLDEDRVFLTISAGFQYDLLLQAEFQTSPAPDYQLYQKIDARDLFLKGTFSFLSSAVFNFAIHEKWLINTGLVMQRTIGDIENKKYDFDRTRHPVEYYFPVSTKKSGIPDITVRPSTKNICYGFQLGVSFLIAQSR